MALVFRTLDTFDTVLPADSVEWCPIEPYCDVLVCGTYQLLKCDGNAETPENEGSDRRIGRIYVFRVTKDGKLVMLQMLDVPAVLDMKWMHVTTDPTKVFLGVVDAVAYLRIYKLHEVDKVMKLELIAEKNVGNGGNERLMALSLDWSTGRYGACASDPQIVVSDSHGRISQFTLNRNSLTKDFSWRAHDFEAWITAFDYWQTNCFYSGGDDCELKLFDSRKGPIPVMCNSSHGAGVTSIHSNANKEFLLATGSYDEVLRLWDKRNFKRELSENRGLAGGIWRLKWHPISYEYLLAACMHSGCKIVNCANEKATTIISVYNHDSLLYGCDWSLLRKETIVGLNVSECEGKTGTLVGTCSFYDHTLKVSAIDCIDETCPDV